MGERIFRLSFRTAGKQDVQADEDEEDEQGGENTEFHGGGKLGFDRADGRLDDLNVEIQ
jgi:hypothetical protein